MILNLAQELETKLVLTPETGVVPLDGVLFHSHEVLGHAEVAGDLLVEDHLARGQGDHEVEGLSDVGAVGANGGDAV